MLRIFETWKDASVHQDITGVTFTASVSQFLLQTGVGSIMMLKPKIGNVFISVECLCVTVKYPPWWQCSAPQQYRKSTLSGSWSDIISVLKTTFPGSSFLPPSFPIFRGKPTGRNVSSWCCHTKHHVLGKLVCFSQKLIENKEHKSLHKMHFKPQGSSAVEELHKLTD